MRVGVLELLAESVSQTWGERMYNLWYKKILASITPQAVAAWCRQLGHHVYYATYYGQSDPKSLLPEQLDIVFIATYTQASALAYALAKLYRRAKTITVIGGPHAKAFPIDCLRFFASPDSSVAQNDRSTDLELWPYTDVNMSMRTGILLSVAVSRYRYFVEVIFMYFSQRLARS